MWLVWFFDNHFVEGKTILSVPDFDGIGTIELGFTITDEWKRRQFLKS